MFRTSQFDKQLDKATSNLKLEPDWPIILQICDLIRQGDVQPKYALGAIKKKMSSTNPHVAMFALLVLESCVKNCGSLIHDEIGSKAYMEMLRETVNTTPHENVKNKLLELIQAWAFAFRNSPKYRAVKDTLNVLKVEGYKFPVLKESDAMFSADTAPEWADGECCHRCRVQFNMMQRKHHCRACGQVFCGQCSSKNSILPKFGIEKEVRVCEACYEKFNKPVPSTKAEELPIEYLTSTLAQQSQAPPPRKSEAELKEEEDLQLALALSQSEAEHKTKGTKNSTPINSNRPKSYSPPPKMSTSPESDPDLARYLNKSYWQAQSEQQNSPSAPIHMTNKMMILTNNNAPTQNGVEEEEMEEFVTTLRSQVEIFVNRMKSNSSRGRSIANDSSVQTLFMNITAMHSRLLRYIQQQDDSRVYYEGLQDKLAQVKDARAALDALREEHMEKMRREAEIAERQRQMQMAHKLDIMRKKKQEYLQYQRQLALQRIQEQEREMQVRQEQQKQQYLMGSYATLSYLPPSYATQAGSAMQGGGRFPPPPPTSGYPPYPPGGMVGGGPMMGGLPQEYMGNLGHGMNPNMLLGHMPPGMIGNSGTPMAPPHPQAPAGMMPGPPNPGVPQGQRPHMVTNAQPPHNAPPQPMILPTSQPPSQTALTSPGGHPMHPLPGGPHQTAPPPPLNQQMQRPMVGQGMPPPGAPPQLPPGMTLPPSSLPGAPPPQAPPSSLGLPPQGPPPPQNIVSPILPPNQPQMMAQPQPKHEPEQSTGELISFD